MTVAGTKICKAKESIVSKIRAPPAEELVVRLEESDSELLLFVPFVDRERAKKVDGRRWDPQRKCWVYPKSPRTFDALVGEFGDELMAINVPRPSQLGTVAVQATMEPRSESLNASNVELTNELSALRETMALLHSSVTASDQSKEGRLQKVLIERERELAQARGELAAAAKEIHRLNATVYASQRDMEQLRRERDDYRVKASRATVPASSANRAASVVVDSLFPALKTLAKQTATTSNSFRLFLDNHVIGDTSPLELGKFLEGDLRSRIGVYERTTLHDLIKQAEDAELISDEGVGFAHLIRRQRNQLAHDSAARATFPMRAVLSVSAAALFWSELE